MQTTFDEKILNLPCEDFFNTVASNPSLLQKGYEIVYKYLSLSPFNREQTLLHLLSQKAPVLTLVTRTYPIVYSDQSVGVSTEQKVKTKQFLILEILLKQLLSQEINQKVANKKVLTNFLLFLNHFHNNEGFEGWVQFYEKLLQQLIKINSDLIGFVLIQILKNSDDRVSCFSKHILPFVINNQTNLKINEQQSLQIIYYCIKSMAYMKGTQDDVLEQYFEPFQEKILAYILASISKSIKIMKYSLKILTVFAADYEVQLEKEMVTKLKECSKQLIVAHLNSRIQQKNNEEFDDEDDEESSSISVIVYQFLELFETLLSVQQMKMADFQVYLSLCLPALLLGKSEYLSYGNSTETYLADIECEGEKTLRNKVVSFLLQLYEGEFSTKTKGKMQSKVLEYVMMLQIRSVSLQSFGKSLLKFFTSLNFPIVIQNEHLPLFEQSMTFLLYHLTEEILTFDQKSLQQNKQTLMMALGKNIETSAVSNDPLIKVSCINLLNKLIKSMSKGVKEAYYGFLVDAIVKIADYQLQKGYLLGICRGIAYVSNDATIAISEQATCKGMPILTLQHLTTYLLDPNTLQQSAHLILQFFMTLLKKTPNAKKILTSIISSQVQIHILSTFIHDGMIADVVIELFSEIASQEFVSFVFVQFSKGLAKQENLALLISKWVSVGQIKLIEGDVVGLIKAYKAPFVSKIVKEYLKLVQLQNSVQTLSPDFTQVMNDNIQPSWVLVMLGCKILRNPEQLLVNTIENITYQLTSQYEIESQLLLPYYTFMNDPAFGVNILKSKSSQLYEAFMTKLIRYAALFQGSNLKVITSIILLNICEIDNQKIQSVIELISTYGNTLQNEEWEDENDKDEENVIDRMFNMKMTNDQVEKDFAEIFGNKVFDMELVGAKVNVLAPLIGR